MNALHLAGVRHLLRHPAQLALALVGLALGVGTIVAVEVATESSRRAFELSLEAVNGPATHQITGGPRGIDERLYVRLRAQSFGHEPPLLLADEPTGNLDEQTAGEVLPALLSLARARNTTVVIVTHDLALSRAADRVLELREGRLHERREPAVSAPR
ncbi:MAG: hypothetical protein E6K45_07605 [Gammaproteobacteria bacterium]|nr:MAG: hypothetical protein E6K45_07605 [Gammaproteobacteria bacterium]